MEGTSSWDMESVTGTHMIIRTTTLTSSIFRMKSREAYFTTREIWEEKKS